LNFRKGILIVLPLLALSLFLCPPVLRGIGNYLAPCVSGSADVVVIEADAVVKKAAIRVAAKTIASGRARRAVVVLHWPLDEGKLFLGQEQYPQLVIAEIGRLGLQKEKTQIISVPIGGHPITKTEAQFVLMRLSTQGVRSAIVLSEAFHGRRSLGIYDKEARQYGIKVFACPYFLGYSVNSWWRDVQGINDLLSESIKLTYYLFHGYLSVESLFST
jgi:hypothetical protein